MRLLDGKAAASFYQENLKSEAAEFFQKTGKKPHLAALLVGNSGPSETYVAAKMKTCESIGFKSSLIRFSETISQQELIEEIDALNADPDLHGFIVQLPLPGHLDVQQVILRIDPDKDVDGFHPVNVGRMALGQEGFVSATPWGIVKLLEYYQIATSGKHAVVLGRSHIVGMPMSLLLSRSAQSGNATVTICHSKTQNLSAITQQADIIVAAIGIPNFLKADMVKEGAVVVDVGITRISDPEKKSGYRIVGDVDFDAVKDRCEAITPVPGGVGPMTITALMMNTMKAAWKQIGS